MKTRLILALVVASSFIVTASTPASAAQTYIAAPATTSFGSIFLPIFWPSDPIRVLF